MTEWHPPTEPPRTPIFEGAPRHWQDLQGLVALLFTGMGCTAEVEKSIETARGSVELDVFATDSASGHNITYCAKCNLW
jgi:restriction system protein